jgi:hypothetical protein
LQTWPAAPTGGEAGSPTAWQERQTYFWRIFATGACFVLFGIGGLILGLLVFPAMLLLLVSRRRAGLV